MLTFGSPCSYEQLLFVLDDRMAKMELRIYLYMGKTFEG